MSKLSSTTGVLTELDRCPISIKAWVQSISYWHRLETGQSGSLIENSYLECKGHKHAFYQNVEYLLRKNGLRNIYSSPQNFRRKQVISMVKQNLTDQNRQLIHDSIKNDDKFSTLRLCNSKNVDNRNRYLYYQTIRSPHIRKCFARLRLDRGNNYNAETEKKCDECDVPLNSTHLLTECTKSMSERRIKVNILWVYS